MTEFQKSLIRCLIEGFEAASRPPEPVAATVEGEMAGSKPGRPGPSPPCTTDELGLPGPEELALYLVLRATRDAAVTERPEETESPAAVRLRDDVYIARDDWRIGVLRGVRAV